MRERDEAHAQLRQFERTPSGKDLRFLRVKRAFARMYHPDNLKPDLFDTPIRGELFKEFWGVMESIESDTKPRG